jgi:Tol biopolymer transport system component/DNA-binding winged helix-turn-helix (wHTH) protein
MAMSSVLNQLYEFGPFRMDPEERVLLREGNPVPLTPKVFDTLLVLVRNRGRIVTKDEMMSSLWPDAFVEESNLTFNIRMLRKALGEDAHAPAYIETIPRRGYRFKSDIKEVLTQAAAVPDLEPGEDVGPDMSHDRTSNLDNVVTHEKTGFDGAASRGRRKLLLISVLAVAFFTMIGVAIWRQTGDGSQRNGVEAGELHSQISHAPPVLKIEQLTNYGTTRIAVISPDGKHLAYSLVTNRQESLWLRQVATSNNVQIIPPAHVYYLGLAFSRDGEHLYYVQREGEDPTSLYRMSIFGGPATKLITGLEGQFSLSPDGGRIAFVRDYKAERKSALFVANADGSNERRLIARSRPEGLWAPVWSPADGAIVCVAGHTATSKPAVSVIEVDATSGTEKTLLKPEWFFIRQVQWLPDVSGLLMIAREKLTTPAQLWRVIYPDGKARKLADDANSYLSFSLTADASKMVAIQARLYSYMWVATDKDGSKAEKIAEGQNRFEWTPDGRIVYGSQVGGNSDDIWIMRPDGSDKKQLTCSAGANLDPSVSPDGRYVVFNSDRSGTHHLWRMHLDGSNQVQLTNGFAEKYPSFSSDSKWVFYNSVDDQSLWKVSVEGGEPVRLSEGMATNPSASPDGRLIAYFQYAQTSGKLLITVSSLDDMRRTKQFDLAPGSLASTRLQWDYGSKALVYAVKSEGLVKLYRQNLNGGSPQQAASLEAEDTFHFAWPPHGQRLAFMRGNWQHDALIISGLK